MEYNDEPILSINEYENMAKAYNEGMKERGFIFVRVDREMNEQMVEEMFDLFFKINRCLFLMGGFLNTSSMYSLTDRQIKRMRTLFDYNQPMPNYKFKPDKTSCFLKYIALEFRLLKCLLNMKNHSNYDVQIEQIINDRLIALGNAFPQ